MLTDINAIYQTLTAKAQADHQRNHIRQEHFLGYEVAFYDYETLRWLFKEIFINKEYHYESPKSDPLIIDCGANIGLTTLYFKQHYPDARIMAFEPNPFAYKLLLENIRLNRLQGIDTYNVALHDAETTLPFFIGTNVGSIVGSLDNHGQQRSIPVKTARLSTYLHAVDSVDLIKMDVEGAEWNLVKDLSEAGLLTKAKRYIIEYHHYKATPAALGAFLAMFEAVGFTYTIEYVKNHSIMQAILLNIF